MQTLAQSYHKPRGSLSSSLSSAAAGCSSPSTAAQGGSSHGGGLPSIAGEWKGLGPHTPLPPQIMDTSTGSRLGRLLHIQRLKCKPEYRSVQQRGSCAFTHARTRMRTRTQQEAVLRLQQPCDACGLATAQL